MFRDFITCHDVFQKNGVEKPLLETLRLFDVLSNGELQKTLSVSGEDLSIIELAAQERKKGMPMEYILNRASFMGRSFFCTRDSLIPTEETRLLVMTSFNYINDRLQAGFGEQTVIEIGTGCGNIAISTALLCDENVTILASDISQAAIEIARRNVHKFNVQEKVLLFSGDLFEPFYDYHGKTDMIICNPPYIPTTSLKKLSAEIIDYEPIVALDGGPYGISFFRKLISTAATVLKQGGVIVFEIGEGQENLIERLFEKNGHYKEIQYYRHEERVRVVSAVNK